MIAETLSDEVWSQLRPSAARLNNGARLKAVVAAAVLLVCLAGVLALTASGQFVSRLNASVTSFNGGTNTCTERIQVTNHGWFDQHVIAEDLVGSHPGLVLRQPISGGVLPSGESRTITLRSASKRWCSARETNFLPAPMRSDAMLRLVVRGPWRTTSVTLQLSFAQPREGFSIQW